MGRERHSDKPENRASRSVDSVSKDDTRYGAGTTHRGLPPKRGHKPSDIAQQIEEGIAEHIER